MHEFHRRRRLLDTPRIGTQHAAQCAALIAALQGTDYGFPNHLKFWKLPQAVSQSSSQKHVVHVIMGIGLLWLFRLETGGYLKSLPISTFALLFLFNNSVLAETLLDKAQRNADFTGTELGSIYMAQLADQVAKCEALIPGFKEKAKEPIALLKKTKEYLDFASSPDFKKLALEATELVKKQHSNVNIALCTSTLNGIRNKFHGERP